MRVLLLHNRYRQSGGEERAVAELAALLRERGHELSVLERSSQQASALRAARALLRGGSDPDEVGEAVRRARVDVVHAHNVQPLFGWRALAAAHAAGARTVLHLHNYRLVCAVAVAYRDGHRCYECHGRATLPSVIHRCRGSLGEAAVYAAGLSRALPRLLEAVDQLVTVSDAAAERLASFGVPAGATAVLPNFVAPHRLAGDSAAAGGTYALVAGRLVAEKGYDMAIGAARAAGMPLVVAGEGPDEARLRSLSDGAEVTFAGHVSEDEVRSLLAGAAVVLVPSRWDEPFGYAALDALAAGVPVLVSDRGALPSIVGAPDCVVGEDDVDAWSDALSRLWSDPELRRSRGQAGIERVRERFDADRYYDSLMELYGA
jgi:glycosyltransferase involved in cell wall biosynthesis